MPEQPISEGSEVPFQSKETEVDIVLPDEADIPLGVSENRGYDATVPEELRKERGDATLSEELAREVKKQKEYIQMTQLYTELQALALQHVLPDDYRQGLPQEIEALIDELTPEFRKLSLYRSTTTEQVKRGLEGMVRRQELGGKIGELQELIRTSKSRIEEIEVAQRAPVSPRAESGLTEQDAVKIAELLEQVKTHRDFQAMPVVWESEPQAAPDAAPRGSFFAGIKRLLSKK